MAKKKAEKKKKEEKEADFEDVGEDDDDDELWTDEEDEGEELVEIDPKKVKFTKIKELKTGMEGVNVEAVVDFVGGVQGKEYGEEPRAIGFIKDDSGEIKVTLWGDDIKNARKGRRLRILQASVTDYKGQVQINPHRKRGIDFL
jgi:hypothetical protein